VLSGVWILKELLGSYFSSSVGSTRGNILSFHLEADLSEIVARDVSLHLSRDNQSPVELCADVSRLP